MKKENKSEDESEHPVPPLVSWYFGGAETEREVYIDILKRIAAVAALLIAFKLFGMNGIYSLFALYVVGIWIFVWRKVRDRT